MKHGTMLRGSKTPEIMRLHAEGLGPREIARRIGCTSANVCKTIRRRKVVWWTGRVAELQPDQVQWLEDEARRIGVDASHIARSLLIDAITEARGEG